jgi:hypothetical protein
MNNLIKGIFLSAFLIISSCKSPQRQPLSADSQKTIVKTVSASPDMPDKQFENNIYLKIDEICTGKVYTNKDNKDVFYSVLVIPEEENLTLIAENISIGEEGGNYQLIKRIRLTDDNSVLPEFGLRSVDSLKFVDSVKIEGYFNEKKRIINIDTLKGEALVATK